MAPSQQSLFRNCCDHAFRLIGATLQLSDGNQCGDLHDVLIRHFIFLTVAI